MEYRKRGLAILLAGVMAASVVPIGMVSNCKAESAPLTEKSESIGPVTSKDVIYQIITDRFCDGDKTNNVPRGFDASLFDGTGRDLKLYQGGDWQGIINQIPYLKGMGITTIWVSAPYENRDTEIDDYQKNKSYFVPHIENTSLFGICKTADDGYAALQRYMTIITAYIMIIHFLRRKLWYLIFLLR